MTNRILPLNCCAARTPVVNRILDVLARQLRERAGVELVDDSTAGQAPAELVLDIRPGLGAEGYELVAGPAGAVCIRGNDARGLLYGVGKFLRTSRIEPGRFEISAWRGQSVPAMPMRGIYFATHFHNYYHAAPLAEVARYIEELALWGCNALMVWFDMHHYRSLQDPAAQAMLARLKAMLRTARELGLSVGIGVLGNEAYADSPEALRADSQTGRAHYRVELCPAKPGAKELMLRWLEEEIAAFAEVGLDYLWIWPYDQGGCACEACRPWGANGLLRMAPDISRAFKRQMPNGKVVLSTWLFDYGSDQGEWAGLARALAQDRSWVDYILADTHGARFPEYPLQHGVPGGLPLLNFPEISMYAMLPWGGVGANPFPARLKHLVDQISHVAAGGFPYSEGIYEDLNKVAMLQLYWDPSRSVEDVVREYATFEFGAETADDVVRAVALLEQNHGLNLFLKSGGRRYDAYALPVELPAGDAHTFVFERAQRFAAAAATEAEALVQRIDARLLKDARTSWRWRVLFLRARLDAGIERAGRQPSDALEAWLTELHGLYHADQALLCLTPPHGRMLAAAVRQSGSQG